MVFFVNFATNCETMFGFLKNIRRRKRLRALQIADVQAFPRIEELKNVAFVWRVSSPEEVAQAGDVVEFFKSAGLKAKGVVIEYGKAFKNTAAREEFADFCQENNMIFVPKKQVKWYGFPKGGALNKLNGEHIYDMTISICPESDFSVEYLAAGIRSNFVTGMCEPQWCNYSFILDRGQANPSAAEYLAALFEYMRRMRQE